MTNENTKIKQKANDLEENKDKNDLSDTDLFVLQVLTALDLIRKGVELSDSRLIGRALRYCNVNGLNIKTRYLLEILKGLEDNLDELFSNSNYKAIIELLGMNLYRFKSGNSENDSNMTDGNDDQTEDKKVEKQTFNLIKNFDWSLMKACTKECITFLGLLIFINLYNIDVKNYKENKFNKGNNFDKQYEAKRSHFSSCLNLIVEIFDFSRKYIDQSMDLPNSKVVYYYSRVHEICGLFSNIRGIILESYRKAVLNHNSMMQAACINLILRNYVLTNRCDLGLKALGKMTFPENISSGIQQARYLYYCGRIYATQLDYNMAFSSLTQSSRKIPKNKGIGSLNFNLYVQKFSIVVQLLMGEVPDRSIFNTPYLRKGLVPYLELVKAVRSGDMKEFDLIIQKRNNVYQKDGTLSLIQRLPHNVIRSGLKTICLSYSRIYLDDIANYLGWDNSNDIEGVVSKAIFDKVIDAKINDDIKCVETNQNREVYGSESMINNIHSRIELCLLLRNNAIKAMEYPQVFSSNNNNGEDNESMRISQEEIDDVVNDVDDGML
ncbi:hypothetical protein FG386_002159 [Cryptosporidium ryanae]|uniref:uncharacterized protein n=1 Tax=Cryptosporidium ryanae TaxID=515981 RepID=UPI003519E40D|nr:hypothetical protein FG386_002159 [Cryptosporidium ryanae]